MGYWMTEEDLQICSVIYPFSWASEPGFIWLVHKILGGPIGWISPRLWTPSLPQSGVAALVQCGCDFLIP